VPTFTDHVLVLAFAVAYPLYGTLVAFPRLKRALAAGIPGIRLRAYFGTIVTQWALVAVVFWLWLRNGRALSGLGLHFQIDYRFWTGLLLAAVAAVAFAYRSRQVMRDPRRRERFERAFERVGVILPHSRRELRTFMGVAVTAGVCEEILYRGFLLSYCFSLFGGGSAAVWYAVVVSSVFFGFAHTYQGWRGILLTGLIGLLEAMFYVLTASLWVSMLLHVAIDVNGGRLGYEYIETRQQAAALAGEAS
jgi:membrane protease YdiL (CAAX protease family)